MLFPVSVTHLPQFITSNTFSVPERGVCRCDLARSHGEFRSGIAGSGGYLMRKSTLGVLLSLLLVAWPALAQEQRGSIQGVVKDNSGAVLPGATVEARSNAGAVASTTTDANGVYRFPSLAPGIYEVTAILQGFSPQKL